ncbi:MAG TPA: GNAT family N-acetyltransferase [Xenococcaceae cyanobacterium]
MTVTNQPNNWKNISASNISVKYQWVYNLTTANTVEFDPLTFPSIKKRWQATKQRGYLGGVAAFLNEEMVGLVLVELLPKTAEIISFFVTPQYRHQGIGCQLFSHLEKALIKLKCPRIQLKYRVSELTEKALESIFKKQNWETPRIDFLITKTTIEALSQAPWVYKYPLPKKFTVFPWVELTNTEKASILKRKAYPDTLNPFIEDPRLEPLNSLGLHYQGEVIGWTINHRIDSETIRYSVMFVEEKFQRMGRGFSLLTEAVKRQIDSGIPYATAAVASKNTSMLHCVERYHKPYAMFISESRYNYKILGVAE